MRVNRFVFLNLPILSLGDHLGVTTSPQSPLPAGCVTLLVDSRSPPLGLMLYRSVEQGKYSSIITSFSYVCIPRICTHTRGSRRTIGNITNPYPVWLRDVEPPFQAVFRSRKVVVAICCLLELLCPLAANVVLPHQPLNSLLIHVEPSIL